MNSQEYQMNPQDYQMNPAYYPVTHVWDESLNEVVPHNSQDIDIDWESEDIQNQFSEMVSSLSNSTSPQGLDGTVTSGIVQGAGVYANESGPAGGMDASNSGGFNFQEQMPYSIDPALLPAPVPVPPGPFFAPEAPAADSIFAQEFDVDFGDDNVVRDVLGPNNQDARVQKRGKGNGNGKAKAPRRPKGATPDKPARAVRAFSCKSCRRKKTKCDGSPGHACSKCQKSGTACEIDGRDGRTSKTTIDKYESLRVALNAHLVRLAQICHHFRQKCNGPEELGQVAAGAAATLEVHRRRGIPIEPWRIQDILRTSDPSTNQLPGYRSRLVQVGQQAKQMTNTLAKLMVMLTQQDYYLWCDGCRLTDELFDSNPEFPSFDAKINAVFVTDMQDYIYQVLADEVDGIIAQHL
ncbi:hypothetical protein CTAM01_07164 [Colletotrichum tamarilloi]|uniref:Zn(2)-C6 fungal-type domain-containing protein n=1 Tax=Colletotrichum tamarilloi TaxID=1209934 RepID=A0ABQ9RAA3_9PEZI|nr:uncharacterized protein CTAM01_07164 [Colletotrichum tamarilloi]KAK1499243.1 hypothetical protein CTAM01_07164 [Colletotrichum tamarilloi]